MAKLLVVCSRGYNGRELWTLLEVLLGHGHTFEVVSTHRSIFDERTLQPNTLKRTVYDIPPEDVSLEFDGICIVSGDTKDTEAYWTDTHVKELLLRFSADKKVIGAICRAVPTLGPVISGVKVSYFPLVRVKHLLQRHKAILNSVSLTVDKEHRTITAENEMLTELWAEEINNMLHGFPQQHFFSDSGFVPKGRPRRMPKEVQSMIDDAK